MAADVDCWSAGTTINCDTCPEDDLNCSAGDATICTLSAIGYFGTVVEEVSWSSVKYKTEKSLSIDVDGCSIGSTMSKDHAKLGSHFSVIKDV